MKEYIEVIKGLKGPMKYIVSMSIGAAIIEIGIIIFMQPIIALFAIGFSAVAALVGAIVLAIISAF